MNPFGNPMGMNMGMPMNMGMMPMNMGMGMGMRNNMMDDTEWLKGFQMGVDEIYKGGNNDDNDPGPKINLTFTTTVGSKRVLKIKYGTTISQAIKKYLDSVGKPELFVQNEKINFLYNANRLEFNDNRLVEVVFKNITMPKIVVNDTQGLIGAYIF